MYLVRTTTSSLKNVSLSTEKKKRNPDGRYPGYPPAGLRVFHFEPTGCLPFLMCLFTTAIFFVRQPFEITLMISLISSLKSGLNTIDILIILLDQTFYFLVHPPCPLYYCDCTLKFKYTTICSYQCFTSVIPPLTFSASAGLIH